MDKILVHNLMMHNTRALIYLFLYNWDNKLVNKLLVGLYDYICQNEISEMIELFDDGL